MDEENEILEAKKKIDKEVEELEELEARITEEQADSDYEDADVVEKRVAPIKKELAKMKKLQEFGRERLVEIRQRKYQQPKKDSSEYLSDEEEGKNPMIITGKEIEENEQAISDGIHEAVEQISKERAEKAKEQEQQKEPKVNPQSYDPMKEDEETMQDLIEALKEVDPLEITGEEIAEDKERLMRLFIRKHLLQQMLAKENAYLKDIFAAIVLDNNNRKYYLYLVNQSDSVNCSRISSLTGAFLSDEDDVIETNRIEKEYGPLSHKSFLLLEEDYQNMLDFTIWYNLDIQFDDKKLKKTSFHFRYPHESEMETLPIVGKFGKKIELNKE